MIEKTYGSPRLSWEVLECALPITFDQYNNCGFNCCYCFSQYQKGIGKGAEDYFKKKVKSVDVNKIKDIFLGKRKVDFSEYIRQRKTIQWGGLADPFCPFEKLYGVGLELLKFFNEIEYPISFSSKGDLILQDERYLNEFKKAGDRWHYKATIITTDEEKARNLEIGVTSPTRRLEVLKKLSEVGVMTTLRLRPFIIGVSDRTMEDLIRRASKSGVKTATMEFFCLENRSINLPKTRENYNKISKAIGFDVVSFYRKFNNKKAGYLRLDPRIKEKYIQDFYRLCKKYGIVPFSSDGDYKHINPSGCCCGILDEWKKLSNYSKLQFTQLASIDAKKKGYITMDDIQKYKDDIKWQKQMKIVNNRNLQGRQRHVMQDMSVYQFFQRSWDNAKSGQCPCNAYGGMLCPRGRDKNGHLVYFYNRKRER